MGCVAMASRLCICVFNPSESSGEAEWNKAEVGVVPPDGQGEDSPAGTGCGFVGLLG